VVVAALAAPFLLPLWRHPSAYLLDPENGYRYVTSAARLWLPFETTQSHLKPGGGEDFMHGALWIKPLATSVHAEGGAIRIDSGRGELLVGSTRPLPGLRMIVEPPAPEIGVSGAQMQRSHPRPGGGSVLLLRLLRPRAVHRMWWSETEEPVYLYEIRLDAPSGFAFHLQPLIS
jgi:hypothetical protein